MKRTISLIVVVLAIPSLYINCSKSTGPASGNPNMTISSPADSTEFIKGDEITFAGTGYNDKGTALPDSVFIWTSDHDDTIGTGTSFVKSDLSVNKHLITLNGTDNDGRTGSESVMITIVESDPTATILSPDDGVSFFEDEEITFTGAGTDLQDGTLSGASLVWSSDKDGVIGSGTSFSNSDLSLNTRSIFIIYFLLRQTAT